jgi:hypothetical protein
MTLEKSALFIPIEVLMTKISKKQLMFKDPDLYAEIILEGYERGLGRGARVRDTPGVFLLDDFLMAFCILSPDTKVETHRLWGGFRIWYHDTLGDIAPSEKWFEAQMTAVFKKVQVGDITYGNYIHD